MKVLTNSCKFYVLNLNSNDFLLLCSYMHFFSEKKNSLVVFLVVYFHGQKLLTYIYFIKRPARDACLYMGGNQAPLLITL